MVVLMNSAPALDPNKLDQIAARCRWANASSSTPGMTVWN